MGLAGRKQKQRIPADPRNLSWADDASRFGLTYLSKFGWDASQGLGSSGDGMKTHLKVQQKLDLMGIGAQHQRDPNGIAWKQNKEFEALLERLNQNAGGGEEANKRDVEGVGLIVRKVAMGQACVCAQKEEAKEKSETNKRKLVGDPNINEDTRKRRKKEKKEKKGKHHKSNLDPPGPAMDPTPEPLSEPSSSKPGSEPIPKSRPMAHRARIRAAKRIAGKSESAIAEILGITPSSSVSSSTPTRAPTPPISSTPAPQPSLSLDNLTTSTKSVADYFKEKLVSRLTCSSSSASSSAPSGSATPGLGATGLGRESFPSEDEDELPRRGIGSQASLSQLSEAASTPADSNSSTEHGSGLTEKQRRRAERKAEKQKRRTTKASEAAREDSSITVIEQAEEGRERAQRTSKEEKKQKKRHGRKEWFLAGQSSGNDDDDTETTVP